MPSQSKTTEKSNKVTRPPIVVVLGHVDHGKSTLLDYIRKTNTVDKEAGGITQHIGAYQVTTPHGQGEATITFIDTPGHEAFSKMRARGAAIADIAILVVAADDGVKAQTREAIEAIKAAKIPFIVAINKTDKPGANVEKTKQDLAEAEVLVEGYGGDIPVTTTSAKTGQGVPDLLDLVLLVAEIQNITTDPVATPRGFVIESHLDSRKGATATLILIDGKLHRGNFLVIDGVISCARTIEDFIGNQIEELNQSQPAQLTGFSEVPPVGAEFRVFDSKKEAENYAAESLKPAQRQTKLDKNAEVLVPTILKADTAGSLEAITKELSKLENEKVALNILSADTGNISENDIKLAASATRPLVVGFNVKVDKSAAELADISEIKPAVFDIIYKLTEWAGEELKNRELKHTVEEERGRVKILRVFNKDKSRQVVGGTVTSGVVALGQTTKILRRDEEIARGKIKELQLQKLKVERVEAGNQCGLAVEAKINIAEGDVLVSFETTTS